ncbi:MAG TPA: GlsB/YeaQ/YmgE family stress response membrane protein [Candidatus Dormibacteraeota bacterium]|nr:GlsB/YeaQ/YmgE family stress response membrane protein [Candidatus Dormibacteraeota bacterium]
MTITLPTINLGSSDTLIFILVGLIAGLLASTSVGGRRNSLFVDMIIGVIGAFFGRWIFGVFGINLGVGLIPEVIEAFVGAFVLLLVLRAVGGGFWHRPA